MWKQYGRWIFLGAVLCCAIGLMLDAKNFFGNFLVELAGNALAILFGLFLVDRITAERARRDVAHLRRQTLEDISSVLAALLRDMPASSLRADHMSGFLSLMQNYNPSACQALFEEFYQSALARSVERPEPLIRSHQDCLHWFAEAQAAISRIGTVLYTRLAQFKADAPVLSKISHAENWMTTMERYRTILEYELKGKLLDVHVPANFAQLDEKEKAELLARLEQSFTDEKEIRKCLKEMNSPLTIFLRECAELQKAISDEYLKD